MKHIAISGLSVGNDLPLTFLAGPCALQSIDHAQMIAGKLKEACDAHGAQLIFKGSFDKANRTSVSARRGSGMGDGLKILEAVKTGLNVPVVTDIHLPEQCAPVAEVADILQIPAFLCRQTDLLVAAGETGAVINVKKGQFLAPWDMVNVIKKIESTGNDKILLTERGTSFGYNTLVSDMRGLAWMRQTQCPVVFDATHSVQQPGGQGTTSGGQRSMVPVLARAAVAAGISGLFMETHPHPDQAKSDGPNMWPLDQLGALLETLQQLDQVTKSQGLIETPML